MCVVSFVGEQWNRRLDQYPYIQPFIDPSPQINPLKKYVLAPDITRAEFDQLKKDIEFMKQQLAGAKEYDKRNNEPDCEIEEKIAKLREIANLVGIDLDEILQPKV